MKNILKFRRILALALILVTAGACEEFLNRPTEDTYTVDSFYKTDEQCYQAANVLYNAPWYDFQRGWVKIGDVMAGNIYYGTDDVYQAFILTSSNSQLADASNSLWLVNGHSNAVIENIATKAGPDVSQATRNTVTGEAMVWKAMAYFYLVRGWGAVPIIHSNSDIIGAGTATDLRKNRIEDVYEYIIRTLEKAVTLLPAQNAAGRLDQYSAYGLLAKVYLTRSGWNQEGTRNQADLDKAKEYAGKVVNESGRTLEPVYSNLFRISTGNRNRENLISWQWVASDQWTSQNSEQSDLALNNFTGLADSWGTWVGPTIDLQRLFGDTASSKTRVNVDVRRKATMMMYNDYYPYFWRDKGGFTATWDDENNVAGATFGVGTGANCVKHIVGNTEDHKAEYGSASLRMATSLSTHILRLADVYLIYAEAVLGNQASTSDPEALRLFNLVRQRGIANASAKTSLTFMDIFNERRLELSCEGDNWYDLVRLHYYNPTLAKQLINRQERGTYNNLKAYYRDEVAQDAVTLNSFKVNLTDDAKFFLPFPDVDISMNKHLLEAPVEFDFSSIGY
ncbi:MAG: RagB/SusD family nutrient uptake outer membrane protein [Bacteroidales bacterium]|nr:RagB/SusD family nutrient uptake outer membrane protein [Bacteroidales bacterium]